MLHFPYAIMFFSVIHPKHFQSLSVIWGKVFYWSNERCKLLLFKSGGGAGRKDFLCGDALVSSAVVAVQAIRPGVEMIVICEEHRQQEDGLRSQSLTISFNFRDLELES